MAEFLMPALGADMQAGTLTEWLKQPGDTVSRGEIVAVVHTDKADVEVEVFTSGVIERVLVEPGTEVPVGTVLAVIREDGAAAEPPTPTPERAAAPAAEPAATPSSFEAAEPHPAHPHIAVSPSARHLAEELGVDLADVQGSGPNGRIQRKDVEAEAAARTAAPAPEERPVAEPAAPPPPAAAAPPPAAAPPSPKPSPRPAPAADERNATMRRAIAASMSRSKREVPHFYLAQTIDMSNAIAWLAQENQRRPVTERLLHGVLLVKAVALALREVPELNAVWDGETLVTREDINVGVAISLRGGGGLVAPAIHGTDQLALDDLMHAFRDLVSRARSWSLRSSEMTDPTITVTSLGERGVESVFGVIFPPQVAIVGFGNMVERPWVSEGHVLACPVVNASLSADHRVTDGHRASAFLAAVDRLLQEPEEL